MNFLQLQNKNILVTGVANKKSLAFAAAQELKDLGAQVILSVQNESIREKIRPLFPETPIYLCDVEIKEEVEALGKTIQENHFPLWGMVHSLAYGNFSQGIRPFHETLLEDFEKAQRISCFSLISLAQALKNSFAAEGSVVTISISNTKALAYGYLGPIKAMLESSIPYLAKSFSTFSRVRFNAICAGPLKTSASSGIPGYVDNYLYAEQLTLRKQALQTAEVAHTISFLLSPQSSGINGASLVVDAGLNCNFFDQDIVKKVVESTHF